MSVATSQRAAECIKRISWWYPDGKCEVGSRSDRLREGAFPWVELVGHAGETGAALEALEQWCPGLTAPMIDDLLTPDVQPEGESYEDGAICLASTFSVAADRPDRKVARGTAQGAGVLTFQPVELIASHGWIVSCWHPRQTFEEGQRTKGDPGDAADLRRAVERRWRRGAGGHAGDLGISIMHELALTYGPAERELHAWLEEWELSLYRDNGSCRREQLSELWGLMAVLRDWVNSLDRPGVADDLGKAWLPASDERAIASVSRCIERSLDDIASLSNTMRQSFGVLHVEQGEEQRRRSEEQQRERERGQQRFEIAGVVFLVPTLIVGFYGANTWVPGQGRHWGFWIMVVTMLLLTLGAGLGVRLLQRR